MRGGRNRKGNRGAYVLVLVTRSPPHAVCRFEWVNVEHDDPTYLEPGVTADAPPPASSEGRQRKKAAGARTHGRPKRGKKDSSGDVAGQEQARVAAEAARKAWLEAEPSTVHEPMQPAEW